MNNIWHAISVELLKARRSKMPWLTAVAFSLAPLMGGLFMMVAQDPDLARRLGIISVKAQMFDISADWPTYLGFLGQGVSVGGIIIFGFVSSWVFGREYSDRTMKDLLALPTPRFVIALAKFAVVGLWSAALTLLIYLVGLGVGTAVGLPPVTAVLFWQSARTLMITAGLTIPLTTPIAFFATAGRGYLPPLAAAMLAIALAQIVAAMGWGEYFPWSVPAMYAGMAGPEFTAMGAGSYAIVFVTSLLGLIGTLLWWEWADQAN